MAKFRRAPEVAEVARELIVQHHPHLLEVRMEYVFGDAAPVSNGAVTLGKAIRVSGVNAELARLGEEDDGEADDFFCIVMYDDIWPSMNDCRRAALVDHELTHCKTRTDKEGNLKLFIQPHDLEEFTSIVERHGLWSKDVEQMALAIKHAQLAFPNMTVEDPRPRKSEGSITIEVAGRKPVHTNLATLQRLGGTQLRDEETE